MTTISNIFDIPTRVHQGDFVLRLTEGVTRAGDTLRDYVVTPQLVGCFNQALELIKSALEADTSKGAYLHGSFGSGKSHFMAVLSLLLQQRPDARAIPELAGVVSTHNAWTAGRNFLVVPYHLIGASSLEAAVLGHYTEHIRKSHPDAPTPPFYPADRLFENASDLRATMGDEAFFANLGSASVRDDGWGSLDASWDAEKFDAALEAPLGSDIRAQLVSELIDSYFQSMPALAMQSISREHRDGQDRQEAFVPLDEGLSAMSKHAQALGYDAIILFLDELILWLASHAADTRFINREGQKVAQLIEAMVAERPIPIISFVARQRDLRELVGEHLPGAEQRKVADVLNWSEARFDTITLEDRNLPAIVQKRLLKPKSKAAVKQIDDAFVQTTRGRDDVMNTLLTRSGDRDMFRQLYPFSPALVQTLVAVSARLQRERTALRIMLQLLVNQRDTLELGQLFRVGDLFDVIVDGDEPFSHAMRVQFDNAKKLYRQKLLPMLKEDHGFTTEAGDAGDIDPSDMKRFQADARLIKTLVLSALAQDVEVLRALTPSRLAALNHGDIRSIIPGEESQTVLSKCRKWAARVGEIKITDDSANPVIYLQLIGVDTESILANTQGVDNYGNRVRLCRTLLYGQLGLDSADDKMMMQRYPMVWRGTQRHYDILFSNVRELTLDRFLSVDADTWRVIIDYPFDEEGYSSADDRAKVDEFVQTGESSNCLVWLPSFLNTRGQADLGRLVRAFS